MSQIYNVGIFETHPGGKHASVAASKNEDRAVGTVCCFKELNKLNVVHHDFISSEVDKVLWTGGGFLISEWPALAEVS